MKEHSRRAFVARSAAAVVSGLIPGRAPGGRLAAAQARRKLETLAPMPVTCYLRHFSWKEGKSPSGQGEVWFVSGDALSEAEAEVARSSGVKILEVHASGAGVLPAVSEVQPGVWNFAFLEEQVPLVRRLGMVPLVSFCTRFMARWEYENQQSGAIRCLEHGVSLPLWSPWNRAAVGRIRRIVHEAARRLRQLGAEGAPVVVDAHGDFGEPIFPQGMAGFAHALRETGIDANPHLHDGFWCGDKHALGSLKATTGLDRLPRDARDERAWVSFHRWYHDGMTECVRATCEAYRAEMPQSPLMVYLGGGTEPLRFGQDNSGITKAIARHQVGIRSTASGSTYSDTQWTFSERFERNWPIIKRHATPARLYRSPLFWVEPPYPPAMDPALLPARMFEAMSCGATAFHEWIDHLLGHAAAYRELMPSARIVHPRTEVAVYFPLLDHWIANASYPEDFWRIASRLRRFADYDVLDDRMILDGALGQYRLLVLPQVKRVDAKVAEMIRPWALHGGMVARRPEPISQWPGGQPAIVDGESAYVAKDMDDGSLIASTIKALSRLDLVACDERPVYATRCKEGWLLLNLSRAMEKVDVCGRTVSLRPLAIELAD